MDEKRSIWQSLREDWHIKKRDIKNMGINPNKECQEMTIGELQMIADFLDVSDGYLLENIR